jgi:acetyl esterase/lipase
MDAVRSFVGSLLSAAARPAVGAAGAAYRWADIPYLPTGLPKHRLDAYVPRDASSARPAPAVLFVHGGGWQRGDKDMGASGVYANVGFALAARRVPAFVASYRLAPEHKHPAQVADVAAAAAWVLRHAGQYGADPQQLWLVGHSAGAHLCALLAAQPRWLAAATAAHHRAGQPHSVGHGGHGHGGHHGPIAGVVAISGSFNLPRLAGAPLGGSLFTEPVFGSDPQALVDASPLYGLSARHSALCHVPVLLVNAEDDWFLGEDAAEMDAAIHTAQRGRQYAGPHSVPLPPVAGGGAGAPPATARSAADEAAQEARFLQQPPAAAAAAPEPLAPAPPSAASAAVAAASAVSWLPTLSPNVHRAVVRGTNHFSIITSPGGSPDPLADTVAGFVHKHARRRAEAAAAAAAPPSPPPLKDRPPP